jgi:hypothetical protein
MDMIENKLQIGGKMNVYEVVVEGTNWILATAQETKFGWRYIPCIPGRKGSRKFYKTPQEALKTPLKWNSKAIIRTTTPENK